MQPSISSAKPDSLCLQVQRAHMNGATSTKTAIGITLFMIGVTITLAGIALGIAPWISNPFTLLSSSVWFVYFSQVSTIFSAILLAVLGITWTIAGVSLFQINENFFLPDQKTQSKGTPLSISGLKLNLHSAVEAESIEIPIVYLDLSQKNLNELPAYAFQHAKLKTLDVNTNKLSKLPAELSTLKNVSTLFLQNNMIKELPESIGNMQKLSALYVSNNQLSTLPESIVELKNLTKLDIRNNPLKSIPKALFQLPNLQTLLISPNQKKLIPNNIDRTKLDIVTW